MDIQKCIILAREKRVVLEGLFLKGETAESVGQIESAFSGLEKSLSMVEEMIRKQQSLTAEDLAHNEVLSTFRLEWDPRLDREIWALPEDLKLQDPDYLSEFEYLLIFFYIRTDQLSTRPNNPKIHDTLKSPQDSRQLSDNGLLRALLAYCISTQKQ